MTEAQKIIPLVVDLDGTLIKSDMLVESVLQSASSKKPGFLRLIGGLLRGKAELKILSSEGFSFEAGSLPYRHEVLHLVEERVKMGGQVVLATAAAPEIARAIADHFGFFNRVFSSQESLNLSGDAKAKVLTDEFGANGFDYIGDSRKDLPVWQVARTSYLAGKNRGALRAFNKLEGGIKLSESEKMRSVPTWIRSLRVHQWVKNLLIFTPAIAAHQLFSPSVALNLGVAFISFSLLASAVYLINDVVDLQSDRQHPSKRSRPIPSGQISIVSALGVAVALVVAAFIIALFLPVEFLILLVGYFVLTSLYSLRLKKVLLLDVITLAGLYTLRVVAGGLAVGIEVSSWLLAFSFFIFLSLSFVKRSSELSSNEDPDVLSANGRAYDARDMPVVNALGISSGLISVLVFALYLDSGTVMSLYQDSGLLWFAVPVLTFWISWVWIRAGRGEVDEDPIIFALRDKASLVSGVVFLAIFLVAQLSVT